MSNKIRPALLMLSLALIFFPYMAWANIPDFLDSGFGGLSGLVVDSAGRPLSGAEIYLECGARTYTNGDGTFMLESVPSGTQQVMIMKSGYNVGKGRVTITPKNIRSLKVSLSKSDKKQMRSSRGDSSNEDVAPKRGNFYAVGKALHIGPRERRVWVYKIEVNEIDNAGKSWTNTWWDDVGDSRYSLTCDEATIGKKYRIKITWRSHGRTKRERSESWDVEFTHDGQSFIYDHP